MPTWGQINQEIGTAQKKGETSPYDRIRRKYLVELNSATNRAVILYSTNFVSGENIEPGLLSIGDDDLQGLMEVCHGIVEPSLDLILHSPGGSIDAAEGLVIYLRSKFENIRVIVPGLAMSAATMMACAADRIVMGKHSFLGPIDPQLVMNTDMGRRTVSADEIIEQFGQAQKDCANPSKLGAWIPILKQYGPDLLVKCNHAMTLSKELVKTWLAEYMLKDLPDREQQADDIASWLVSHKKSRSHGRHLPRVVLRDQGLVIDNLEDDQSFQDTVLSIFHAVNHTFNGTPAVKIIENHLGRAYVRQQAQIQVLRKH